MITGDIVKVAFGITDPKEKQGQTGKVIKVEEQDEEDVLVWVLFEDGITGIYEENCLTKIK